MNIRESRPDFMIVGAPKSATTTLHRALCRYPDIFMTEPKEPAFFSNPERQSNGMEWYRQLFDAADPEQLRGEASSTYSRHPYDTAPNTIDPWPEIARCFQGLSLVYLVRDPISRSYSHYRHWLRKGNRGTFEEAMESEPPIIDCSRYRIQIERIQSVMGDVPMFIETFDRMSLSQSDVVQEVRDFLGLQEMALDDDRSVHENKHGYEVVLGQYLKTLPFGATIRAATPQRLRTLGKTILIASPLRRMMDRQVKPFPMLSETKKRLREKFEPDIAFIESLVTRSLDSWRSDAAESSVTNT